MEPLRCDHYGEADSIQSNLQRSIIQFQICRPTTSTGKMGRKGSIFTCFIHHFNVDIWEEDHRYTRNLTNHVNSKDLNIFCLCLKYPFCLRMMWCYMDLLPPVHFYKLYFVLFSSGKCSIEGVRSNGFQRRGGGPGPRQPKGHSQLRQDRTRQQGRLRSFQVSIVLNKFYSVA